MRRILFFYAIPLTLLLALFAAILVTVFTHAGDYGITIDEPLQNSYGRSVLAWYETGGHDQSFLHYPENAYVPEHGPIFEVIVALTQQAFGGSWHTRAIVTGLAGFVGIVAIALCGFEIGGPWSAFLAAGGLWLYPRFFGALFNNSKDIPFTSAVILAIWSVLLLVKRWDRSWQHLIGNAVLVGFLIGFAIAIRITALFWCPVMLCLVICWWICYGLRATKEHKVTYNLLKQCVVGFIIIAASSLTIIALWPYIALNPLHDFYESYIVNSKYPVSAGILFRGYAYPNAFVPRNYAPVWLFIGSPPAIVVLAAIGCLVISLKLLWRKSIEGAIVLIALTFLIPLGIFVCMKPAFYDAMRQFLFLVPSMILIAVYGFVWAVRYCTQRRQKVIAIGLVIVLLIAQLQVFMEMRNLYPYEYIYISPLIGGVSRIHSQYEMDYWGICDKPSAEWLAQNYQKYTRKQHPTIITSSVVDPRQATLYLPKNFEANYSNPDFYIGITRFGNDAEFSSYKVIHTEGVEGYIACITKAKGK